ncbi:MAG: DUF1559 domain-containing protein [Planctomycetaceae bacterium]
MTDNPYASPELGSDTRVLMKRPRITFLRLFLGLAIVFVLVALLLPATVRSREVARRTQCKNNLKQIALALHNYESKYHALPPAYTVDADGKPLHSWRTLILPFVDEPRLYGRIDLSKPWNDPANADAYETVPQVFRCPSAMLPPGFTSYLGVVGSNACFHPTAPRAFLEMTDGTTETLMVIEVAQEHAVHWMAPQDASEEMVLDFGNDGKLAHTGGTQAALAALADGSTRFLSENLETEIRRALISIAGKDRVGEY